jgi:hypothetical protein
VLAALSHVAGSIALPNAACRIGGYDFVDGAILHPFIDLACAGRSSTAYQQLRDERRRRGSTPTACTTTSSVISSSRRRFLGCSAK